MVKKVLQFLLFLGIGVSIMAWLFNSQNTAFQEQCRLDGVPADQCSLADKLLQDFGTVNLWWILAVLLAFTVSNIFRAWRWQMLLEPMGYQVKFSNSLMTILVGYLANLVIPRMGEVVRAGSLARYEKVPMEKVMGTLVVDRLMDFICLLLVVGVAFLVEGDTVLAFITQNKKADSGGGLLSNPLVWGFLAAMGLVAILIYGLRKKLAEIALFRKVGAMLKGFLDGLRSVFKLKNPALFIAYSLGIWVMFYLQCLFNLKAFPPTAQLDWSAAMMVFVFGTFGFVIPSPGGMGTFHALCIASLALYGINGSDGFSYANIAFFSVQIFYNLVAGGISLLLLPRWNRRH
ncbi:MAG: flippase-like domain-containing protein [Saprospiraceae bacterium]|nr:flippase-like domain-containing protein [Saprospiraceae bacterium]